MAQALLEFESSVYAKDTGRFKEAVGLEFSRQEFLEEQRRFEDERKSFEREKQAFSIQKNIEDRRLESERQLFNMKWKLLEEEVRKLASEKAQVEKQRDFYKHVNSYNDRQTVRSGEIAGNVFFVGVGSEQSLKKRYKDLLKIYHPDNPDGDTGTLQEINREYDKLRQQYEEG